MPKQMLDNRTQKGLVKSFALWSAVLAALCLVGSITGCNSSATNNTSASGSTPPSISSLSPSTVTAGSAGITLAVQGSNFVAGTEITWGGTKRTTVYVSSGSLQTALSAADLASAATVRVSVVNPQDAGGAASGSLPFTINAITASNPVPVLTSISPSSGVAGASDTTVTLTGSNFLTTSTVSLASGVTLASTYQSATSLSAVIPASYFFTAGSLGIAVTNPAPGGGTSSAVSFTITNPVTSGQSMISITANDLAWDPVNQVIYLSLPSAAGTDGNSIQVLNPATGALGKSVSAGSEPDLLGVSESSKYLYVVLDGSSAVQRFTLPDLTTDINVPLGTPPPNEGSYFAVDLQPSTAADGTFVVSRGLTKIDADETGGVVIFDDAVQRPDQLCGSSFPQSDCVPNASFGRYDSIQWSPAADEMYMLNNEDSGSDFYTAPVNSSGFGSVTDYPGLGGGGGDTIHYDATTKRIYTDHGIVIDPATGTRVGSITTPDMFNASGLAAPDGAAGIVFYLEQSQLYVGTYTLESFDINDLTPIGTLEITGVVGRPLRLIRWGTNGLAFATTQGSLSTSTGRVYLISGSFVTTSVRPADSVPSVAHRPLQQSEGLAREGETPGRRE